MRWFWHGQRREPNEIIRKIVNWRPTNSRQTNRSIWKDQVIKDTTKKKVINWRERIRDRKGWSRMTNKAKIQQNLQTRSRRTYPPR